jgi:hypothetical protein
MILKPHERRCVDFSNRCCDRCFGKVVGSAVDDIIMPVVGLLTGGWISQLSLLQNGESYANLDAKNRRSSCNHLW